MSMTATTYTSSEDMECLNLFLKNELAAVETYGQCIESIQDAGVAINLRDLQRSHEKRAELLTRKITQLGGQPEVDSGLWGDFAKLVEGGAAMLGNKTAINALEKGEKRGEEQYRAKLDEMTPDVRAFVSVSLLPEHETCQQILQRVERMVH